MLSLPFSSSSIFMRWRKRWASTSRIRKATRAATITIRLRTARASTSAKLQSILQEDRRAWRISCRWKLKGTQEERIRRASRTQRVTISAIRGWQRSAASLLQQWQDQSYSILVSSLYSIGLRQQTVQTTRKRAAADHSYDARVRMKKICRLPPSASPKRLFVYDYWHPSARAMSQLRPLTRLKPLYPRTT